jgi:hypothetical protein
MAWERRAVKDLAGVSMVMTGGEEDSRAVSSVIGVVRTHPGLRFDSRSASDVRDVVAFISPTDKRTVLTLLSAFDAIPEAWVDQYQLTIVSRFPAEELAVLAEASFHSEQIRSMGSDLSDEELENLVRQAATVMVADPAIESRAYSFAMDAGVPVVIISSETTPKVPGGYIGALVAAADRPVSIHVAMTHGLRLANIHFPSYPRWRNLIEQIQGHVVEALDIHTSPDGE